MEIEYKKLLNNDKSCPPGTVSIIQHLEKLKKISSVCEFVAEVVVEEVISTFALAQGLVENNKKKKILWGYDIVERNLHSRWDLLQKLSNKNNITLEFKLGDSIKAELPKENMDMIFLDGWHVYGQVIRELKYFSPKVNKFICFHDTTTDGELGETIRSGWDAEKQSRETGIPIDEINKGIWYAIEDFIKKNDDWIVYKRYTNNNGLTILSKNNTKIIKELDDLCL